MNFCRLQQAFNCSLFFTFKFCQSAAENVLISKEALIYNLIHFRIPYLMAFDRSNPISTIRATASSVTPSGSTSAAPLA